MPQKPPRGTARGPPQLVLPPPPPYPPPDMDMAEPLGSPGEGAAPEAADLRPTRTCPRVRVRVLTAPPRCLVSGCLQTSCSSWGVSPLALPPSAPGSASRVPASAGHVPERGLTLDLGLWLGFSQRYAVWVETVGWELMLLELEPTSARQPLQPRAAQQRGAHSAGGGLPWALVRAGGRGQRSEGQGIRTGPRGSVLSLCGKGD